MNFDRQLQRLWYERKPLWLLIPLLPLSLLFALVVALRRAAYRSGLLRSIRIARPVVVIGNITVGGTGKTPFVIWLAQLLQAKGLRVGIVLRGYGGASLQWPREVLAETSSREVGDEAVLLATRTGAIVVAGPDRVAAARRAVERGAEVVLSDDGLQHYRLARDVEIAVIDEYRGLGNRLLLPAGPLREPASRLKSVDLLVRTQRASASGNEEGREVGIASRQVVVKAQLTDAVSLITGERRALETFRAGAVHAIAGIGHPAAFFGALQEAGLAVDTRALPDHAQLTREDIRFADDAPVLMTEKDAVKCRAIADERHWAVRLETRISESDAALVSSLIDDALHSRHENR